MRIKKKGIFLITVFSLMTFLYSCDKKDNSFIDANSRVEIEDGALIEEKGNELVNLQLKEAGYKKLENKDTVVEYNKESGNYIFIRNNEHYIFSNGKENKIEASNYENLHLSEDGKYIAYMTYDNSYILKVINAENNKEIDVKSKVAISGKFFDFIGDNTLIYYGISEKNENGIFSYNLDNGKEELLYKLDNGYLEFFKVYKDEVVFLQRINDDEKILKSLQIENKNIKVLSKNIDSLNDVVKSENNYYILGSVKSDGNSVYSLIDGTVERLVYDFPEKVNIQSGLSINEKGEILFMGSESGKSTLDVYCYNKKNGEIKLLTDYSGVYNFIKIN